MRKILTIFILISYLTSISNAFPGLTKTQTNQWVENKMNGRLVSTQKEKEDIVVSYGIGTNYNTRIDMFDRYKKNSKMSYLTKIVAYASVSIDDFVILFKNYNQKKLAKDFQNAKLDYKKNIFSGNEIKYIGKKYTYYYYFVYYQDYYTILEIYNN